MSPVDAIRDAAGRMRAAAVLLDMAGEAEHPCEGEDYLRRARVMLRPIVEELPADLRALLAVYLCP
jgi:hypothetical protein